MALLSAYFDESGSPNDTRSLIVSGFVSTVDQWTRFEQDWKIAHRDFGLPDPSKTPFHMKDFAHFKGAFSGWKDDAKRKDFARRLVGIIAVRVLYAISIGIHNDDYRSVNKRFVLAEGKVTQYPLCASACVFRLDDWAQRSGYGHIEYVFEDGGPDKGAFVNIMSKCQKYPKFGRKPKHLPCQAADLMAYEALKVATHLEKLEAGEKSIRQTFAHLYVKIPGDHRRISGDALEAICKKLGVPERPQSA